MTKKPLPKTAPAKSVAPIEVIAAVPNAAPAQPFAHKPTLNQPTMETQMEKITATTEEFVTFGQANVEAFVKSSQIWATGVQDLQKTLAATAQAQMDAAMSTLKALSGVKSVKEAFDLHSTLARSSVETAVAETGKLTDASMKLAEQAIAPITARVTIAMEKFGKAA